MYQISQIFVANYGVRGAFFPNRVIDLRKGNDVASSVMLFAENGRGKTSFLSMMLHMFIPFPNRFVQYQQKKQSHRFEHYFQDGRPCLFFYEFVRQKKDMFAAKEPTLVIGVCSRKRGDGKVEETFFRFAPTEGMRFDDLEPVRLTKAGERLTWGYAEANQWLKDMKALSETKPGIAFRTFDTYKGWMEALVEDGFRLNDYSTMLSMATREGGLDAFMQCKDSSDMLAKLHELFTNEPDYADEITQINHFLSESKNLPAKQAQLGAFTTFLEKESAFVDQLFLADQSEAEQVAAHGVLKGLRLRAEAKRGAIRESLAAAKLADTENTKTLSEAERQLLRLRLRHEASRIAIVAHELAETDSGIKEATLQKQQAERRKQVHDRIYRDERRVSDLRKQIASLERTLAERREAEATKLEPVRRAGAKVRALGHAAIDLQMGKLERNVARRKDLKTEVDTLQAKLVASEQGRTIEMMKRQQVETLLGQQVDLQARAASLLSGIEAETIHELLQALRVEVAELRSKKDLDESRSTDIQKSMIRLEGESTAAEKDLKAASDASTRASNQLQSVALLDRDIRASLLKEVTAEDDIDLTSQGFSSSITSKRNEAAARSEYLRKEIGGLEERLVAIREAGSFEDDDVLKALKECRKAGLQTVQPFALWLSEQNIELEEARSLVENNLDVALGLMVTSPAEFELAKRVFNRESWQLRKPVGLSLFDGDFFKRLQSRGRDKNYFALPAHNDYAINRRAKADVISAIEAQVERMMLERDQIQTSVAVFDALLSKLETLQRLTGGKTVEALEMDWARALEKVERAQSALELLSAQSEELMTALDHVRQEIAAGRASIEALGQKIGPIEKLAEESERLSQSLSALPSQSELIASISKVEAEIEAFNERKTAAEQETDALFASDQAIVATKSGVEHQIAQIAYCDETTPVLDDADTLQEALIQYERRKLEYERDIDPGNFQNNDQERLTGYKTDLASLEASIAKTFRDIAVELSVAEDVIPADLTDLLDMSEGEIEVHVVTLQATIRTQGDRLEQLREQKTLLQQQVRPKDAFDPIALKAAQEELAGLSVDALRIEQAASDEAVDQYNTQVEALRNQRANLASTLAQLSSDEKDIGYISDRLKSKRWELAEPADLPGFEFSDMTLVSKKVAELVEHEEALHTAYERQAREANKRHADVRDFVAKKAAILNEPEIADMYARFDASYKSRKEIGGQMLKRIEQIGIALQAEIELLSRSENELLTTVGRLYEIALGKIIRATKIKVPETAKSQFAGCEILQLPEKVTAKALKEYPSEEVARNFVDTIRRNAAHPQLTTMAAFSVQLLNIVSQALIGKDFELLIMKPVVGAKIQYDLLHKMTGSGGQTITAALLLYLVATNLAGNSESDSLLGFLILDNPIGSANNTQLVMTQLSTAKDFGVQMISTTGIMDDYLTAYEMVLQFSAAETREGRAEVDIEPIATGGTEIELFDFELKLFTETQVLQ